MKKIFAFLLTILMSILTGCEKDDICTEETTPRLILEFYDTSNNAVLKNVVNLKVKGEGAADFIVFNTTLPEADPNRYLFNGNKIELPLKIDGTTTKYSLTLDSTSPTGTNEDILQFNYTPHNVFVSRACGYKTTFTLEPSPNGVIKTDTTIPVSFWIQDMNILTTNIVTENETHIKIYF
jgi:hypothetical protein